MPTWLAALVAVGAIAATYFFCMRSMLRGKSGPGGCCQSDAEDDREIGELREELRILRAQDTMEASSTTDPSKGPPTASN